MKTDLPDIPAKQLRNRARRWREPAERLSITFILALKVIAFLAGSSFVTGTVGYYLLRTIMPDGWVFGALYRMFLYHWAYPAQYIGLVSLSYAFVASLFILARFDPVGKWPRLSVLMIVVLSIAAASPAGGVLWVIHDMQAGYFPSGSRFWEAIKWGAKEGIADGWLIILLSVPYNILGLVAGYWITRRGHRMTLRNRERKEPRKLLQTLAESGMKLPAKNRQPLFSANKKPRRMNRTRLDDMEILISPDARSP